MSECAVKRGREEESWIDGGDLPSPKLGQLGLQRPVKGCVDLGGIEEAGEIFERMHLPLPHARWIENALPVFIRPPRRADADRRTWVESPTSRFRAPVWIGRSHGKTALRQPKASHRTA